MKIVKKFSKKIIIPSVILVVLLVSGIAFAVNMNNKPHKVASASTTNAEKTTQKKQTAQPEQVKEDIQPVAQQDATSSTQTSNTTPVTTQTEPADSPEVAQLKSYGAPSDDNTMSTALAMTTVGNKTGMKIAYARAYTAECQASQLAMIGCVNEYVNQAYGGSWPNAIQAYATTTARGQGSW